MAWCHLPREHLGPCQKAWKYGRRCAVDGTWERALA
ncbi:hypothetical protein CIK61_17990 [Brevibacterium aurantiacum]|nr:hypothetical protein CIK61_17990 [Brevibacterium aurantiacum]